MNIENIFTDKLSLRIWNRFFNQVTKILRQVPKDPRDELVLELKGHVLESFQHDDAESEPDRLMNALDKLGDPETFLRPLVAEKLLAAGTKTFKPSVLLYGLYYSMFASVRKLALGIFFAAGYLLLLIFFSATIAKLFIPDFGLYIHDTGGFTLGMLGEGSRLASQEVLGIWLVPLGIVLKAVLYIILTKLMGVLMKKT